MESRISAISYYFIVNSYFGDLIVSFIIVDPETGYRSYSHDVNAIQAECDKWYEEELKVPHQKYCAKRDAERMMTRVMAFSVKYSK